MRRLTTLFLIVFLFLTLSLCFAQESKLYMPVDFKKSYDKNARSFDGNPGKNYWQNRADYDIYVSFNPATRELSGNENITYYNNSPDSLKELVFNLFPDFYKKGNHRDFNIDASDESDGVSVTGLILNNDTIDYPADNKNITSAHTSFTLNLNAAVLPGDKASLEIFWHYTVNKGSPVRTGAVDSTTFFIAYFFPRISVYDDIHGWNHYDYTGDAEFYNDFGNFNLFVTVPRNYLVWATGRLQNPGDILTNKYLERYENALKADIAIHIIDSTEIFNNNITTSKPYITWKFRANNVNDVCFALSDHYLWDALSVETDTITGRRVLINTAFNKASKDFYEVAGIAKNVINCMSYDLPGIHFPFPVLTVFNGLDYMEYPMMVNDTTLDISETPELTTHEIFHSYFPFYMGINETDYAWMDEGITSFFTYLIMKKLYPSNKDNQPFGNDYNHLIGGFSDVPLFINSSKLKRPEYNYIYYDKALSFFLVLQDFLGNDAFLNTLKEFMLKWNGKHPTPYDLFFTFERESGKNIDWLVKPWFFEYGYVDLAIRNIVGKKDGYEIDIEKKGKLPAHFGLKIYYSDSSTATFDYNAGVWMNGERIYRVFISSDKKIKSAEITDKTLRDADLSNNKFVNN